MLDHLWYGVLLAPLAAAVFAIFFPRNLRHLGRITLLCSSISLAASVWGTAVSDLSVPLQFGPWTIFYLDALGIYFVLLVNLVAFFASWYIEPFLRFDARSNPHSNPAEFHRYFNFFHLTMLIVPMVDNLVILWIFVELTTIVSTMLVRYRRDRRALEAAWKYIMVTTTGIIFALLGTLFLAYATFKVPEPGDDPLAWSTLVQPRVVSALNPEYVRLSFLFILLGYGTKAGLAPMHTWLPDGHGEAPFPVSALLSGVLLKSALYAILRFYTIARLNLGEGDELIPASLLIVGLFSLALATPFILKRNRFKRVLAYHSLEHMGIIVFGIGIGGPAALFGALLHALNHALTKALMFLTYGYVRQAYAGRGVDLELLIEHEGRGAGLLRSMPIAATILGFGGLALVGAPPFNIFVSELIILWAAVRVPAPAHPLYILAVVIFLITVTIIFGGLVIHLARLLLDAPPFEPQPEDRRSLLPLMVLIGFILMLGLTLLSVPVNLPELLNRSTQIVLEGPGG